MEKYLKLLNTSDKISPPQYKARPQLSKQLGKFTIDALSKLPDQFQGFKIKDNLPLTNVGVFDRSDNTIKFNINHPMMDILNNITHEGNHAINHNDPYITDDVVNF